MTFFEFLHQHRFKILGTACFIGGFVITKDLTLSYYVSKHLQARQAAFKRESEAFDASFKERWNAMDQSFKSQKAAWDKLKAESEALRQKEATRPKEDALPFKREFGFPSMNKHFEKQKTSGSEAQKRAEG